MTIGTKVYYIDYVSNGDETALRCSDAKFLGYCKYNKEIDIQYVTIAHLGIEIVTEEYNIDTNLRTLLGSITANCKEQIDYNNYTITKATTRLEILNGKLVALNEILDMDNKGLLAYQKGFTIKGVQQ